MADIRAKPGSGGKVVPQSGAKRGNPKVKKKVTGAIGSALRRKQYDELGYKYDKTIKANPKAKTVSKLKTQKVDAKSGGATAVKGAQTKAKASAGANKSIIGKPGSTGKKSTKTEKIKLTPKKVAKTKKEGRQDKRAAAKKGRVNKRVKRLENRVEKVSLKGKQATEAGKTGANSRARNLVAKKARLQKRIDNKKNK
jgi:hypothetical protein